VWDGTRARSRLLGTLFGEPIDPSVTTAPGGAPPSVEQKPLNLGAFEWTIVREVPHTYWLDVAWPLFGRYLADIRASAGAVGAPVVVLAIPEPAQVKADLRARSMADFRFREDEVDWGRPHRELRAQTDALGLPVLDLLPLFQARADRDGLYFAFDTHFTALGHQATAEALASFLVEGGWLS
jgi:SGNH hydrolase-like domain, acetyltransferase AlgX